MDLKKSIRVMIMRETSRTYKKVESKCHKGYTKHWPNENLWSCIDLKKKKKRFESKTITVNRESLNNYKRFKYLETYHDSKLL